MSPLFAAVIIAQYQPALANNKKRLIVYQALIQIAASLAYNCIVGLDMARNAQLPKCYQRHQLDGLHCIEYIVDRSMHREEVGIIEGLLLTSWTTLQNQQFVIRNQVGLVLHPPLPQYEQLLVAATVKNVELDWAVDELIYSKCVLKRKCCQMLELLRGVEDKCESTVVCDFGITSKAIGICCLLVMAKFSWSLLKTLQYMRKKVPTMDLDDAQIKSLLLYDKSLRQNLLQETVEIWQKDQEISEESILARNTFLNSLKMPAEGEQPCRNSFRVKKKVSFKEEQDFRQTRIRSSSQMPTRFSERQHQPVNRPEQQQPRIASVRLVMSRQLKQKRESLYERKKLRFMVHIPKSQDKHKSQSNSLRKKQSHGSADQPHDQFTEQDTRFTEMLSRIKDRLGKRFLVSNFKHVHQDRRKKLTPQKIQPGNRKEDKQLKGVSFVTKQKSKLNKLIGSSLQNLQ